jgi:hypothetical protein
MFPGRLPRGTGLSARPLGLRSGDRKGTRQPGREARRVKVPDWEDVTLPKRQPPGGYQEPDLPLRYIPAPF